MLAYTDKVTLVSEGMEDGLWVFRLFCCDRLIVYNFAFETFASALEVKNRINVDFLIEQPY